MSKSSKTALVIALILLVVSTSAFAFTVLHINNQGQKLAEQQDALADDMALQSSYSNLQKVQQESQEDRGLLNSYFLASNDEVIKLLNSLGDKATTTGVTSEVVVKELVSEESDERWLDLNFTLSGSRQSVVNYIKILETLPYVVRTGSVSMTAKSPSLWDANINISIRLAHDYDR